VSNGLQLESQNRPWAKAAPRIRVLILLKNRLLIKNEEKKHMTFPFPLPGTPSAIHLLETDRARSGHTCSHHFKTLGYDLSRRCKLSTPSFSVHTDLKRQLLSPCRFFPSLKWENRLTSKKVFFSTTMFIKHVPTLTVEVADSPIQQLSNFYGQAKSFPGGSLTSSTHDKPFTNLSGRIKIEPEGVVELRPARSNKNRFFQSPAKVLQNRQDAYAQSA
jgi:hypothetical protein